MAPTAAAMHSIWALALLTIFLKNIALIYNVKRKH
jgi:hypothetical protein